MFFVLQRRWVAIRLPRLKTTPWNYMICRLCYVWHLQCVMQDDDIWKKEWSLQIQVKFMDEKKRGEVFDKHNQKFRIGGRLKRAARKVKWAFLFVYLIPFLIFWMSDTLDNFKIWWHSIMRCYNDYVFIVREERWCPLTVSRDRSKGIWKRGLTFYLPDIWSKPELLTPDPFPHGLFMGRSLGWPVSHV